jgi:predicted nucleic acid-binding protein
VSVYADTSFLFSLVVSDQNTPAAAVYVRAHRRPLLITPLQRCELGNAIRLAVFRKHADQAAANAALAQIENLFAAGKFLYTPLAWTEVVAEADRLGALHTAALGVRTLDLVHVAAAVSLGAKDFLTFDPRQRAFAKAAGLRVAPSIF